MVVVRQGRKVLAALPPARPGAVPRRIGGPWRTAVPGSGNSCCVMSAEGRGLRVLLCPILAAALIARVSQVILTRFVGGKLGPG